MTDYNKMFEQYDIIIIKQNYKLLFTSIHSLTSSRYDLYNVLFNIGVLDGKLELVVDTIHYSIYQYDYTRVSDIRITLCFSCLLCSQDHFSLKNTLYF